MNGKSQLQNNVGAGPRRARGQRNTGNTANRHVSVYIVCACVCRNGTFRALYKLKFHPINEKRGKIFGLQNSTVKVLGRGRDHKK